LQTHKFVQSQGDTSVDGIPSTAGGALRFDVTLSGRAVVIAALIGATGGITTWWISHRRDTTPLTISAGALTK